MATPQGFIGKLDFVDRKLSGYVHSCVIKPRVLELIIFPFAVLFQPFLVPVLLAAVGIFMPVLEDAQRTRYRAAGVTLPVDFEDEDFGYKSHLSKPATVMAQYLVMMGVLLLLVLVLKRLFGRIRPAVPVDSRRMVNLRSLENNCSFPSGDTAQGALLAFFIMYNYPYLYVALGEGTFLAKFISMVAIGRVFHHCHFFGDTVFGAAIGFGVAAAFFYSGWWVPVPREWDDWVANSVRDGLYKT